MGAGCQSVCLVLDWGSGACQPLSHSCNSQLLCLGFSLCPGCLFHCSRLFDFSELYSHKETQPDPGADTNANAYPRRMVVGDKAHPSCWSVYIYLCEHIFHFFVKNLNTALKFCVWLLSFWVSVPISLRDPSLSSLYHTPEQALPQDWQSSLPPILPSLKFASCGLPKVFLGDRESGRATLQAVSGERDI